LFSLLFLMGRDFFSDLLAGLSGYRCKAPVAVAPCSATATGGFPLYPGRKWQYMDALSFE
jgi:hypothetical protein